MAFCCQLAKKKKPMIKRALLISCFIEYHETKYFQTHDFNHSEMCIFWLMVYIDLKAEYKKLIPIYLN